MSGKILEMTRARIRSGALDSVQGLVCPPDAYRPNEDGRSEAERSGGGRLNSRARNHAVLRMPWDSLEGFVAGHGMTRSVPTASSGRHLNACRMPF